MITKIERFDSLTTHQLMKVLQARSAVFVVEQQCPYQDIDGHDENAIHIWLEEDGEICAYVRALPPGEIMEEASIGRVISLRRRQGLASRLLAIAIDVIKQTFKTDKISVEAQSYACPLYEKAGFVKCSSEFMMDGIPHIKMTLKN